MQVSESIDWNATNPGSGGITLKDTYDQATNTYYVLPPRDWALGQREQTKI